MYSNSLGRWLETDPEQYIDGPNMYQMEDSNPVARLDPLGESPTTRPSTQLTSAPATQPTTNPVPATQPSDNDYLRGLGNDDWRIRRDTEWQVAKGLRKDPNLVRRLRKMNYSGCQPLDKEVDLRLTLALADAKASIEKEIKDLEGLLRQTDTIPSPQIQRDIEKLKQEEAALGG